MKDIYCNAYYGQKETNTSPIFAYNFNGDIRFLTNKDFMGPGNIIHIQDPHNFPKELYPEVQQKIQKQKEQIQEAIFTLTQPAGIPLKEIEYDDSFFHGYLLIELFIFVLGFILGIVVAQP